MPTALASRRFPGLLQQPLSLSMLVDDRLFDGFSHIVASRNGLLVIDLRRRKHDRALKLGGKDGLGHCACTVLTADDRDEKTIDLPQAPSPPRTSA